MSTSVVAVDEFTTPVVVPAAGEGVTAASILAFVQPLANEAVYLKGRVEGAFTNFAIPQALWQAAGALNEFYLDDSAWRATDANDINKLRIPIKGVAPDGKLTSVTLRYQTDNEFVNGDATLDVCTQDYTGAVTVAETLTLNKSTTTIDVVLAVSPNLDLKGTPDVYVRLVTADFVGTKSMNVFSLRVTGTAAD